MIKILENDVLNWYYGINAFFEKVTLVDTKDGLRKIHFRALLTISFPYPRLLPITTLSW